MLTEVVDKSCGWKLWTEVVDKSCRRKLWTVDGSDFRCPLPPLRLNKSFLLDRERPYGAHNEK